MSDLVPLHGSCLLFVFSNFKNTVITQLTFICSKSPIEALEKGVKYVQS